MIAAVQLKKCVAGAGVFCIIISKFRHQKKSCPVVLFEVDKGSEVDFYRAVLPLGLAVSLRVKDGGEFLFNAKKVEKQGPEH